MTPEQQHDLDARRASGLYTPAQLAAWADAYGTMVPTPAMASTDAWGNTVGVIGGDLGKTSQELKEDLARYSARSLDPEDATRPMLREMADSAIREDPAFRAGQRLAEVAADPGAWPDTIGDWKPDPGPMTVDPDWRFKRRRA